MAKGRTAIVISSFSQHTIQAVAFCVERVVTQLVLHVEQDECTAGHANGQTRNVDDGIDLEARQVANGNGEIISEHDLSPRPPLLKDEGVFGLAEV